MAEIRTVNAVVLLFLVFILVSLSAVAHPGRTDAYGCHTCRTNCGSWGLAYGEYHCHSAPKSAVPTFGVKEAKSLPAYSPKNTSTGANVNTLLQTLPLVKSVIDGDTIRVEMDGTLEKVRLLGIDAPEVSGKQCFAKEATNKMRELTNGKKVRLERDTKQSNRDVFRRLLRYVYLEDGTSVNAEMVKQGYARAYIKYRSDKLNEFLKLEKGAKNNKVGLWGSCYN